MNEQEQIEKQRMESTFRDVLGKDFGVDVLAYLLDQYHFFEEIETEEQIARHNMGIELLRCCKILKLNEYGINGNTKDIVMRLLTERN